MDQVQGLSQESSQEQQQRGKETGLETTLQHDTRSIQETIPAIPYRYSYKAGQAVAESPGLSLH